MSKILIIEDWWADRLRLQYLLTVPGVEIDFAWTAGRPGSVWRPERISEEIEIYENAIVDLAWNKSDEDIFVKHRSRALSELAGRDEVELNRIGGLRLFTLLAQQNPAALNRCIIVSAYAEDAVRDYCKRKWHIPRSFRKWEDESQLRDIVLE